MTSGGRTNLSRHDARLSASSIRTNASRVVSTAMGRQIASLSADGQLNFCTGLHLFAGCRLLVQHHIGRRLGHGDPADVDFEPHLLDVRLRLGEPYTNELGELDLAGPARDTHRDGAPLDVRYLRLRR